jgi:hypothetical protein
MLIQESLEKIRKAIENEEETALLEARVRIVKARVRGGKIQRRVKVAAQQGYIMKGGKAVKEKASERLRRKIAQKRGARKRKAKAARAKIARMRSMRKRKSLGL